ncbi:MAG: fructose-bisphosphatase class II family protein, partial [Actinomycetota bacterium]|nr:fructose-bisphosphatase class II family protein [Actinomycetota bacterium]
TVVTGEGAKDDAPMLADGERVGRGGAPRYELAIDPLECTDLCANGLPGALATIAVAPPGALWSPGPAFYMDKLVAGRRARGAIDLDAELEVNLDRVARALDRPLTDLRVVVLDKPRHRRLVARLRSAGVRVRTPSAGDVAASLEVLLDDGDADLLMGVGGTPEGMLTACAVRALGGAMQGRLAPQRADERAALRASGVDVRRRLEVDDLVGADAVFVATGISGGLLRAIERSGEAVTTESLIVAPGEVRRVLQRTSTDRED